MVAPSRPSRRIGVAIPIPEPYGTELQHRRKDLGDPHAEAIPTHVTLLPPTDVDDAHLSTVEEHLRAVAEGFEPFEMHLAGTGTFRPVSPVVFVRLAAGLVECQKLEAQVRSGSLHREVTFDYHPHVTVAHDVAEDVLDRAEAELSSYDARFPVWCFSLYEHGPDRVWRPQRDYVFRRTLPGPPEASGV